MLLDKYTRKINVLLSIIDIRLAFLLAILIIFFAVTPSIFNIPNSGTVLHLLAYFILSTVWIMHYYRKKIDHFMLKGISMAFLFSVFIEAIQFFIPYRHFEIHKILINFIACVTSIIPVKILAKTSEHIQG
jgi:hypothetical protein